MKGGKKCSDGDRSGPQAQLLKITGHVWTLYTWPGSCKSQGSARLSYTLFSTAAFTACHLWLLVYCSFFYPPRDMTDSSGCYFSLQIKSRQREHITSLSHSKWTEEKKKVQTTVTVCVIFWRSVRYIISLHIHNIVSHQNNIRQSFIVLQMDQMA